MSLNRPELRLPKMPRGIRAPFRTPFRTLGPGSVSSLLKIALDVAYWALWLALAVVIGVFIFSFFVPLDQFDVTLDGVDGPIDAPLTRSLIGYVLAFAAGYIGAFIFILYRLRLVFRTLAAGEPFDLENVRRLRDIGFALGGVVTLQIAFGPLLAMIYPQSNVSLDVGDLIVPIFSVLTIFVLSEVFREGARLRHEQELTI